ncbi:MAG: hypothetical protein ACREOZ_05035 [Gloeomargaritales cyanobacterium]
MAPTYSKFENSPTSQGQRILQPPPIPSEVAVKAEAKEYKDDYVTIKVRSSHTVANSPSIE